MLKVRPSQRWTALPRGPSLVQAAPSRAIAAPRSSGRAGSASAPVRQCTSCTNRGTSIGPAAPAASPTRDGRPSILLPSRHHRQLDCRPAAHSAPAMAAVKVLLAGDGSGQLEALYKRIQTVNAKSGPFQVLFCVGGFFAEGERRDPGRRTGPAMAMPLARRWPP